MLLALGAGLLLAAAGGCRGVPRSTVRGTGVPALQEEGAGRKGSGPAEKAGPPAAGQSAGVPGGDARAPRDGAAAQGEELLSRARSAVQAGRRYLARFLAAQAASRTPPGALHQAALLLEGDLAYEEGELLDSYGAYLQLTRLEPDQAEVPARVWVRLAEASLLELGERDRARSFLCRAAGGQLDDSGGALAERLRRRLRWLELSAETLGLGDANVSALALDEDDLWVGTWNGGVARYSLASGERTVFRQGGETLTPNTVRSIEVTPHRVWVGTYQGLYVYSKVIGSWREVEQFGGRTPRKVEALAAVGDRLFVGTLGDGLWRLTGGRWERVVEGELPGEFVNCLEWSGSWLYVGTMSLGAVRLNVDSGRMVRVETLAPQLAARNVTMLLSVGEQALWVGTYGEGLYRWAIPQGKVEHFTRQGGQIPDDWVLAGTHARSGYYFGTFGGGMAFLPEAGGSWRRLSLQEGLPALDITALQYRPPVVYLGTLGAGAALYYEDPCGGGP